MELDAPDTCNNQAGIKLGIGYDLMLGGNDFEACGRSFGQDKLACGMAALTFVPGAGVGARAGRGISKFLSRAIGGCSSFVPGTRVVMGNGSTKPIETVEVGDSVLATDLETGKAEPRTVVRAITSEGTKDLVRLSTATGSVVATDNHPFWVDDRGEWLRADELKPGNDLLTVAGDRVEVTATTSHLAITRVHNLTVEGVHTYSVRAGDTSALVHNCAGPVRLSDETIDTHILPRHGAGTPSGGSKFHENIDPDDFESLANEVVTRSPVPSGYDPKTGNHAHEYDFGPGRVIGENGSTRMRVWVSSDGEVTSIHPI